MQKKRSRRLSGTKRFIAGLLSLVMMVSYMPAMGAMAAELPEGSEIAAEDTATVSTTGGDVEETTTPVAEDADVPADGASDEGATVDADVQESAEAGAADDAAAADEAETGDAVAEDKGDETEMLGGEATPKFFFALESASNIEADNMTLEYIFKDEDGKPVETNVITINPNKTQNVYLDETADGVENAAAIPDGAKSVVIKVQTAGNTLIYDKSDTNSCIIQVVSSISNAIDKDYELSESDLNAIMDAGEDGNGYSLSLSDDVIGKDVILKVYIKVVKGNNGGGPLQNPQNGQYRVDYELDGTVPAGTTPVAKLQFDYPEDLESPSKIIDVTANVDPVDIPVDAGGYAPETVIVSIPDPEDQKYFQNGYIDVYSDGEYETTICDLFDEFRKRDSEDDPYPYSYTMSIDPEKSYVFRVRFSNTRSLSWSYNEADRGRDNFVENCSLYLLESDGEGGYTEREYVDEAYSSTEPGYNSGKKANRTGYANYQLTIGESYKFKVVPDYGYQVAGLQINSYTITPSEVDGEVGIFEFTMQDFNFHVNGVVEEIGTIANIEARDVGYMTFNGTNVGEIDYAEFGAEFDEGMGGGFMVSVEDETLSDDYKYKERYSDYDSGQGISVSAETVKDMKAVETISIDIDQAVAKDAVYEDYIPEVWAMAITEFDRDSNNEADPVKVAFAYPGEENVAYKIAREHEGKIDILDAEYKDGKLEFTTDGFSEFTILKQPTDADDVVFDLTPLENSEYSFVINEDSGLEEVEGQPNKYTYCGSGDVKIFVKKKVGEGEPRDIEDSELIDYKGGERRHLSLFLKAFAEDNEAAPWFVDNLEDYILNSSVVTIPAISDDPYNRYPLRALLDYAASKKGTGEGAVGTISVGAVDYAREMPARQVIIDTDAASGISFDFNLKEQGEDEGGNPIEVQISNVVTSNEGTDGTYYYMFEDDENLTTEKPYMYEEEIDESDIVPCIRFTADAPDGVNLNSISYKINNAYYDWEDGGKLKFEYPPQYPAGNVTADENGVFKIPYPQRPDRDDHSRLGITLIPNVTKLTKVRVNFGANSSDLFNDDATVGAFEVTARVGAQLYELTYGVGSEAAKDAEFVTYVPDGSDVVIGIKSADGYNALSKVNLFDAVNNGKEINPSKTGEYALKTTGKDSVTLGATIAPVTALKLTNDAGKDLEGNKNKYSLTHDTIFSAYLVSGSKVTEGQLKPVPVTSSDVTFKNNKTAITAGDGVTITDSKLTATGDALKLAGKTLALKVEWAGKAYTASIAFSAPITSVTVKEAKNGKLSVPYNTSKYLNLKIDKGADQYTVKAHLVTVEGETVTKGDEIDFGDCDGRQIFIYDRDVLSNYAPGGKATFAFFVNNSIKSDVYEITFTDELKDKPAPTVKANDKFSTNQAVGLSLSLPKGVKATSDMYYKITATAPYKGNECDKWVGSGHFQWYDGLTYFDEEANDLVNVFNDEVVAYVPVQYKTYALDVTDEPKSKEDGWRLDYEVTVSVVYMERDYMNRPVVKGTGTKLTDTVLTNTKDNQYETKLKLTKKAPKKIYTGQYVQNIATVKYSKNTTVKSLDRVEIIDSQGNNRGGWNRWNDPNNQDPNMPMNWYIRVDDENGIISLNTEQPWYRVYGPDDEEDGCDCLEPGKYKIVAYAVGGSGIEAKASMDINIVEGIDHLIIDAPSTVYKPAGKKATLKAKISDFESHFNGSPDTKKVEWELREVPEQLKGKIKINKKGTVTIDAKANIGADNTFTIVAKAADYPGNETEDEHEVTIKTSYSTPSKISFAWTDDNGVINNYSNITEESIKAKERFFSNSIKYAKVTVHDELGRDMTDEVTFKTNGLVLDDMNRVESVKPGNVSITATTSDGSKKSKTLKFKIVNTNEEFGMNVLIRSSGNDYDNSFINPGGDGENVHRKGLNDTEAKELNSSFTGFENPCAVNHPFYVYVAGVRTGEYRWDPDADKEKLFDLDEPNYHENCMIAHSIKVTGGKLVSTDPEGDDHYVIYDIIPTAPTTVVKVTDKTAGRKKQTYTYTINNTAMGKEKAYKVTADKKSIYDSLDIIADEMDDPYDLNRVTYTVVGADKLTSGSNKAAVRITMDECDIDDCHAIAKALGVDRDVPEGDDYNYDEINDLRLNGRVQELDANGQFTINYYDILENEDRGDLNGLRVVHFDRIPAGTCSFYVTAGSIKGGIFTPAAAPAKVTVKAVDPPAPKAQWTKTAYSLEPDSGAYYAAIEIPTVTGGTGVRNWYHDEEEKFRGDAYWVKNTNTNGFTGSFDRLFHIENLIADTKDQTKSKTVLRKDDVIRLAPNSGPGEGFEEQWVRIGKGDCWVRVTTWYELKMLKEGTFKSVKDGDGSYDADHGDIVVSAAEQKKAYAAWAKQNLTGYLMYRTVDYSGCETEYSQKITVDITKLLDAAVQPQG